MSQKRKQISFELKINVLKRYKSGEKAADIARYLKLAPSTVRSICNRDADEITKFATAASPLQSQQNVKNRSPLLVKMEALLSIWIENQNKRKVSMSQVIIQNKAKCIFNDLQNKTGSSSSGHLEKFEASRGWFQRFKNRTNLHNIDLKGESAPVDGPAAENINREAIISKGGYSRNQILNVDETELYWNRLPKKTYVSKAQQCAPGHRASWGKLWPECVLKNNVPINDVQIIKDEIADLPKKKNVERIEIDDIEELLKSHDEELTNEMFLSFGNEDEIEETNVQMETKKLTNAHIAKALALVDQAIEIFSDNDPDVNRCAKVTKDLTESVQCYKDYYLEKKKALSQQTINVFFKQKENQSA